MRFAQSIFIDFLQFSGQAVNMFLNSINHLIFVLIMGCVFFAVRTNSLNVILRRGSPIKGSCVNNTNFQAFK
jgi:hypothetical protein